MTTFATSEEWLEKASLLVQAYPSTVILFQNRHGAITNTFLD